MNSIEIIHYHPFKMYLANIILVAVLKIQVFKMQDMYDLMKYLVDK